ncbi:MAG: GntR family transcriptional regulator [Bryobacteraceae bacterium]
MKQTLDKQLPIPLYRQLQSVILEGIQSGYWRASDRIPTESELARTYGVSKITVKQALHELAASGYVRREQGRGTFVARTRLDQGPRELTSFTEEMRRHGIQGGARVLASSVITADGRLAEVLSIPTGASVFALKRLRLGDGAPIGIQSAHIPLDLVPGLPQEPMEHASLYETLWEKYGLEPARARETHSAVVVAGEEAELLDVPSGSPALASERISYLEHGRPLEFVKAILRADRYRIVLNLAREPRAL